MQMALALPYLSPLESDDHKNMKKKDRDSRPFKA